MSDTPPALTDLEREIMEEAWQHEEISVREMLDALNGQRGARQRAYTTVMTIMARLDRKGLLGRRREGKVDWYAPALTRDEYLEQRSRAEVGDLVEEYGDLALVHFARHMAGLDPKRRAQLRRLAGRG